jgi:glycosyltransferase involved in cell wall biosynthesis
MLKRDVLAMNFDKSVDLTIISNILMADGIGRQGLGLIEAVNDKLSLNVLQLPPKSYKDISPEVLKVLIKPFNNFGKIAFWTSILGTNAASIKQHSAITSPLKIAYSMFESDAIPKIWVDTLNSIYDMVIVPDNYLVSIYVNSGVKIPIFVIPLGIYVQDLLNLPFKSAAGNPFTFGMSAGFWKRKNHIKLLEAFSKRFGNDEKFKLKLHGRFGPFKSEVEKAVKELGLKNVELFSTPFSVKDYNQFMNEIDCYVFPSMGEGFSVTPRESLALGKPCIVTNNTAHKTICDSGYVVPLLANKKIPAVYEVFGNQIIGNFYDCDVNDLSKSMMNVYDNFDEFSKKAQLGREWVKQYLWSELAPTYLNIFKPKLIELKKSNVVNKNGFQTNNENLFRKMQELLND